MNLENNYKVYLKDKSYGNLCIKYEEGIEDWLVNTKFRKAGKTEVILESPSGEQTIFDITIKMDTYHMTKK